MKATTFRHLVWVVFSSFILGLVIALAVFIFAVAQWILSETINSWWLEATMIAGFALGPIYHAIVWFNSRTR